MSNSLINTAYQQSFHCGLLFCDVDECLLTVLRWCKKFKFHLELKSFQAVTGFAQWVWPVFVTSWRHFSPQKSLQTSQLQVSPVDPIGIHLLLKYLAVWLCCLGELNPQSLISGWNPIMAAPRVIAFLVTLSISNVCFVVYGGSFWTCFACRFVVLKLEPVPSVCRQCVRDISDTIR